MTMIPATSIILFLFEGFLGWGLTALGMDEGTSGVEGRSFGEKSFGINRFSAKSVFSDTGASFGGNIWSGSDDGGTTDSGANVTGLGLVSDGLSIGRSFGAAGSGMDETGTEAAA